MDVQVGFPFSPSVGAYLEGLEVRAQDPLCLTMYLPRPCFVHHTPLQYLFTRPSLVLEMLSISAET